MANLPISILPNVNASGVTPDDLLVIVNYDVPTGTTKNITALNIKEYILSGLTDYYITGGTYSNGTLTLENNSGGTFSVAGFYTGATDVYVTGGTYDNSTGVATFTNNTGGTFSVTGFVFTGNTSGDCITDLYVSNLYGCSPITLNENIEVSDGFSIKAKNGGGKLNLRDGFDNIVSLTTDDNNFNEGWFYGDSSSSSFGFGSNFLTFGPDYVSTNYNSIGIDRVVSFSYDGFRTVQTPFFSSTTINGVIFGNNTSSNFTSNLNNTGATIISSKNSTVNQNVINSVVIGGENITATTDNTVYVPNLNISNVGAGTPVTNLGFDSNGNVVSGVTQAYKVYTALLSQTGTDAPVVTVLENTIGNIVWTRNNVGQYDGTLIGTFISGKTALFIQKNVSLTKTLLSPSDLWVLYTDVNTISIYTSDGSQLIDDVLNNTSLEIRVYP